MGTPRAQNIKQRTGILIAKNKSTQMKIFKIIGLLILTSIKIMAQENMAPASKQDKIIVIQGGTIHIGNGTIINNGSIVMENGKIKSVTEANVKVTGQNMEFINAAGMHIYPGIIAASTNLGLVEVGSVKATQDYRELGDMNPSIKSIVAYAADSKVINTLRSNGILLAHIVPQGGTISGTSSVVQLDAWHWEDAAYKTNNGIHFNMPALINRPSFFGSRNPQEDPIKAALQKIEEVRTFLKQAKAYYNSSKETTNLKYEAVKGLFDKSQKLYVHADLIKEMLIALDIKKEFEIEVVIIGGSDSWMITDILKENAISVILSEPHSLPATADDAVDQPYKTGAALQKAGVLFSICQDGGDGFWRQRDLPFQAGTMAAYGITKEEALTAITLNAAKILGIADKTGSIEVGKDANIIISEGDILDMRTSKVTNAFIQGRKIDLNNKQTDLFEKYKAKYGIK
jgi:imidazolonepropionase-like amidohydrolase